jgi:hypothetical protein
MAMNTIIDLDAIAKRNKKNIENTRDGEMLPYASVRNVVLIGANHDPAVVHLVMHAGGSGPNKGVITVTQGRRSGTGTLTVTGLRIGRAEFEAEIARFSNLKVVYA